MIFHTFPCIFIFILWEWLYYCGIYLASLTYLSHTKDTTMRQVTNEEFLAFNYFLGFFICFIKTVMLHLEPSKLQSLPGCKIPCVGKECRSKTQLPYNKASAVKKPHGIKSCAVSLGLLWIRAFTRGSAVNCSKAGSVLWFFQIENCCKLGALQVA